MQVAGGDEPEDRNSQGGVVRAGRITSPFPPAAVGHLSGGDPNVLASDLHDHRFLGLLHPFSGKDNVLFYSVYSNMIVAHHVCQIFTLWCQFYLFLKRLS